MDALQRIVRTSNEVLTALGQHLDGDVLGDEPVFDDGTHEVEVGLGRRREPDFDLLKAHGDQLGEHRVLAFRVHGVDERLVAVTQVHAAPLGCLFQSPIGPSAVK